MSYSAIYFRRRFFRSNKQPLKKNVSEQLFTEVSKHQTLLLFSVGLSLSAAQNKRIRGS